MQIINMREAADPSTQKAREIVERQMGHLTRPTTDDVVIPNLRVLVVEDNQDARETLRMMLEIEGHRVYEAEDGPSGVEAARAVRPDVALIDIGLPGFDGYEVARRVRGGHGSSMRLIAVSGYGQAEDRQRSRDAGFDAHLVKPVAAEQFRNSLMKASEGHSLWWMPEGAMRAFLTFALIFEEPS
jgi:CheY-like chemotaxis protein